jgi:hypothetical protein
VIREFSAGVRAERCRFTAALGIQLDVKGVRDLIEFGTI